jgi:WD40 repeat protein
MSAQTLPKLKVFISYARGDLAFAERLVEALEARGLEVMIDRRNLPIAEQWQRELGEFIHKADTIVFVVSPRSIGSAWCHWEVGEVAKLNKRLAPVVFEPVADDRIPADLSKINYVYFTPSEDFERQADRLAEALQTDVEWIRRHTRIGERARLWEEAGRPRRGRLLAGDEIAEAETWLASQPRSAPAPTTLQREYIAASQSAARRRLRTLVGTAAAVAVAGLVIAAIALVQWQTAVAERDRALASQSRYLASLSNQLKVLDETTRSTLVGIEAATIAKGVVRVDGPQSEVDEALMAGLADMRELLYLDIPGGSEWSAAFNSAGTQLVVAGATGARVFDAVTGAPLLTVKGDHAGSAAFSPDGSKIVTASADKTARIFDARQGNELAALSHPSPVWDAAFSPNGAWLATAAEDAKIRIWDARSRALTATLDAKLPEGIIRRVMITPDGRRILGAYEDDGVVRVWDLASRRVVLELKVDTEVYGLALTPDGRRLVTGGWSEAVGIWDLATKQKVGELKGHTERVFAVAVSGDGGRIATASRDQTVRLWDAKTGNPYAILRGHDGSVYNVRFSPDGKRVVSASADGTVRVWDATFNMESRFRGTEQPPVVAARSTEQAGGPDYVATSRDGSRAAKPDPNDPYSTLIIDLKTGKTLASVKALAGVIDALDFSPDGRKLVTAERNGLAVIWDASTGQEIFQLRGHGDRAQDAKFSPDGRFVATAARDSTARLWDPATGKQLFVYRTPGFSVDTAAFSPDSSKVLTSGSDGTTRIWSTRSGAQLIAIDRHVSEQTAMSSSAEFSEDGRFIVVDDGGERTVVEIDFGGERLAQKALAAVPRCLTPSERQRFLLPAEPPAWCIELGKWPYGGAEWKQWLADRNAGRAGAMPVSAAR